MMIKIAIFVEGLTEQLFVEDLIKSLVGSRSLHTIIKKQQFGVLVDVQEHRPENQIFAEILIVNCNTDNQVNSMILNNHEKLKGEGYTVIIGLQDLFPRLRGEERTLKKFLKLLPEDHICKIIIAIEETEAWFLEEKTHFSRIKQEMTIENIIARGFDINSKQGHEWGNPAKILNDIYQCWGLSYKKKRRSISRTVNAIDWNEIYLNVQHNDANLKELISILEEALFNE